MTHVQKTVLVIEDDRWTRSITTALLAGEGFAVVEAKDGEEGVQLAQRHLPDAIILDLALPTLSGLEVLRQLKSELLTQDIPVVIVSAYGSLMNENDSHLATGVIQKPFDYDELVAQIEQATRLGQSRSVVARMNVGFSAIPPEVDPKLRTIVLMSDSTVESVPLENALRSAGYNVRTTRRASGALQLIAATRARALVFDAQDPLTDVVSVVRAVMDSVRQNIPIILRTDSIDVDSIIAS